MNMKINQISLFPSSWDSYNFCLNQRFFYWNSSTSKVTSMGLGSQKGFVANPVHAPPHTLF